MTEEGSQMKKLSVVIPAYNEEKMVPKTAKTVSGLLRHIRFPMS